MVELTQSKYGPLRQHQADGLDLSARIVSGARSDHTFVANVTPGGGKTLLYSIVAHELLNEGFVQQVVILVPRDSLRSQVRDGFTDLARGMPRRIVDDGRAMRRGQGSLIERSGYVTTYQAVAADPRLHRKILARAPTLLILDEPHHLVSVPDKECEEDAAWWSSVRVLAELSKVNFLGSGTLWRHDGQPIPLVRYDEEKRPIADITYTRRQALAEEAILPINFKRTDGTTIYTHRGRVHEVDIAKARKTQQAKAVKTFLMTESRDASAIKCLQEWVEYRRSVYRSRAIVVVHSQDAAKQVGRAIQEALKVDVAVAISRDPKSQKVIKRFRDNNDGDVLVTVGMAYEGLDVPDCTHLVCLTDIRSEPWLEQAFARVTRVNRACGKPWEGQLAFIYVLDDAKSKALIDKLLDEQIPALRDDEDAASGPAPRRGQSTFRPIDSEMGAERYSSLAAGNFTDEQSRLIARMKSHKPYVSTLPLSEILDLALDIDWSRVDKRALAAQRGA